MKITSRMLPFEVVLAVKDEITVQVGLDRQVLDFIRKRSHKPAPADWLAIILKYGAQDRELINQAMSEGSISQGACYGDCHHCCSMRSTYEVEAFDILLSYYFNLDAVKSAYTAGRLDEEEKWCGLLEDGLCTIHQDKPYVCLLTQPSPKGAAKGGCCFKGDRNAKTTVHKPTMVATGRMRMLFREYLPELPEFVGSNINQAFKWVILSSGLPPLHWS